MTTEARPAAGDAGLFRPLAFAAGPLCLFSALLAGGVSDRVRGCENTTVVAAGSPEGELYTQHGVPDRVIELANPSGPNVRHWGRYVVEWDIEEEHRFSFLLASARRSTIGYLVEHGKVVNGGYVGSGSGSSILTEVDLSNDPGAKRVGGGK
jgi:hypothetical protein